MICDIYCDFIRAVHHWTVPGCENRHNPDVPSGEVAVFFDHMVLDDKRRWAYNTKFAFLFEPRAKYPDNYECVERYAEEFQRIFTCNRALVEKLPNAQFEPFGTGWCAGAPRHEKTEMIGMIISDKPKPDSRLEGWRLRYAAAQEMLARGLPVKGSGVGPRVPRCEVITPAQFAVEAENCIEPCYFTEKLVDCLLQKTVPLYWGPGCIAEFFDVRGILIWRNIEELRAHLNHIAAGTVRYEDFEEVLERNRKAAYPLASSTSRWLPLVAKELSCLSS